jgi:hypothetical protein
VASWSRKYVPACLPVGFGCHSRVWSVRLRFPAEPLHSEDTGGASMNTAPITKNTLSFALFMVNCPLSLFKIKVSHLLLHNCYKLQRNIKNQRNVIFLYEISAHFKKNKLFACFQHEKKSIFRTIMYNSYSLIAPLR